MNFLTADLVAPCSRVVAAGVLVLLPDSRFVTEPDFYVRRIDTPLAREACQYRRDMTHAVLSLARLPSTDKLMIFVDGPPCFSKPVSSNIAGGIPTLAE